MQTVWIQKVGPDLGLNCSEVFLKYFFEKDNFENSQHMTTKEHKQQDKFDEFISPDEELFERNMSITKHKFHLSNP